jgi:hypothetical protein
MPMPYAHGALCPMPTEPYAPFPMPYAHRALCPMPARAPHVTEKGYISPLFGKLPSIGFVLNRTMSLFFFEPRIPLFPWLVLLAIVIKARNDRPRSFCPSLTCQKIEVFSQLKLTCQYSSKCTYSRFHVDEVHSSRVQSL